MRIDSINNVTTKTPSGFNIFDIDFNNYNLLNGDDELFFLNEAKQGNLLAFEKIVNANYRFVVSIAQQYIDLGLPFIDLIKDGNIGLIKAIDRFDLSKDIKFSNYAIWWIRNTITASLNDYNLIVTASLAEKQSHSKIKAAIRLFSNQYEEEPDYENVMIYGKLTADEIYILITIYFNDILFGEAINFDEQEHMLTNKILQKLSKSNSNKFSKIEFQQYIKNTLGKVLCVDELERVSQLYKLELLSN